MDATMSEYEARYLPEPIDGWEVGPVQRVDGPVYSGEHWCGPWGEPPGYAPWTAFFRAEWPKDDPERDYAILRFALWMNERWDDADGDPAVHEGDDLPLITGSMKSDGCVNSNTPEAIIHTCGLRQTGRMGAGILWLVGRLAELHPSQASREEWD